MGAAVEAVLARGPRAVVVAVPTAPPHAVRELQAGVDELVALLQPEPFHAVGLWYENFREVPDDEVRRLLCVPAEEEVRAGGADAALVVPEGARGLVVFARGAGPSRFSPRNRYVAGVREDAGLATLLVDLLTTAEEQVDLRTREHRFDIELLAGRVGEAVRWARSDERTNRLPVGLFGASTGAAAALATAARQPHAVHAVVSSAAPPHPPPPPLPHT